VASRVEQNSMRDQSGRVHGEESHPTTSARDASR